MPYSAIVFDFFGVSCSEIAPFWLAKHLTPSEATRIKASIVHAADSGQLSEEDMFLALSSITGVPPAQIEQEWLSYVVIDVELVSLIETLRPKYRLGLLTNSPSAFVRGILRHHGLSDLFDAIVVSSENRCAKPDGPVYRTMLSLLSVPPEQALMIDDNPANVTGAIEVGMGGIVFQSSDQLRSALSN